MLVVGVDENGLGPLLGPLVVTAAAFEVDQYDRAGMWRALPGGLRADDSKQLFSRATMAAAERDTLGWLAAMGADAATHADLVRSICLPIPWGIPCGRNEPEICRPDTAALPLWSEPESDRAREDIGETLELRGVRPMLVRSLVACAGAFNRAVDGPTANKLRLDFEMMLHLLVEIAAETGRELTAICGKVGSTRRYGPWLDGLGRFLWTALEEEPASSTYRISGLGTVSFARDADASHLPVAVASMIGKYLRELAMRRLNRGLGRDPARAASGYRDPVTARFVEETARRREELGLEERCFRRSR
jgi:ribonuclease HII